MTVVLHAWKENWNDNFISGAIHTGTGQTHLSELFTVMDLPKLNAQIFKKHERIIGLAIEYVTRESCSEATAMKRFLTEGSIDEIKKLLWVWMAMT